MSRRTPLTVITVLTALLSACGQPQAPQAIQATSRKVTVSIDPALKAERLAPQSAGSTSPEVTEVQFPSGSMEFFEQELVVRVTDEVAFQSFLTKYNGVVVNDGALPAPLSSSLETRVVPNR